MVLFLPGRLRPAILVLAEYASIAFFAAVVQRTSPIALHHTWLKLGVSAAAWSSSGGGGSPSSTSTWKFGFSNIGYNDIHSLLGALKLDQWNLIASLAILLMLAIWFYNYRAVNFWLVFGVTAIVSRLWVYHRVYDDLLLFLPMITLWQLNKGLLGKKSATAGVLMGIMAFAAILPASLRAYPGLLGIGFRIGQLAVWLTVLGFLLFHSWQARQTQKVVAKLK